MKHVLASIALVFGVGFASAGSDLSSAIDLWLQGDDRNSLPQFAELARSNNSDARLLLSRIEVTDKGLSPFRLSLSAPEAKELFRSAPGNKSFASSWIGIEAQAGNELALALLAARSSNPDPETVIRLAELGEKQAGDHPTRIVALYGTSEMRRDLLQSSYLLPELYPYLSYLSDEPEPRGDGVAALRFMIADSKKEVDPADPETLGMAEFLALGFGFGDASASNRWRPVVENWLMSAPSTQPIADLCRSKCGAGAPSCAAAIMALSGGFFEVIRVDSPLETLISQEDFLTSPRARLMTLRRAALARSETNMPFAVQDIAEISECTAGLISETRLLYR